MKNTLVLEHAPLHQGHIDLISGPSVSVIAFVSSFLVTEGGSWRRSGTAFTKTLHPYP